MIDPVAAIPSLLPSIPTRKGLYFSPKKGKYKEIIP